MWDQGANICMTPYLHLLTNIVKITPFAVGVAVELSSFPNKEDSTSMCTMKGDLMLPLVDGSYHAQECYFNPHTMNTLVSPQTICEDSHGQFAQWSMEANTTGQPSSGRCADVITFVS